MIHIQPLFRELAEQVREAVNADHDTGGWTDALLDVRYSAEGTVHLEKLRAHTAGTRRPPKIGWANGVPGTVSVSVLNGDIGRLTDEIWAARGGEQFYGFALSVRPSGEVEIRLNYDPACFTDPGFFES
jgi:hypothetical protein